MFNPVTIMAVPGAALSPGAGEPSVVAIPWVHSEDPGNVGESAGEGAGGYGPDRVCGAMGYE